MTFQLFGYAMLSLWGVPACSRNEPEDESPSEKTSLVPDATTTPGFLAPSATVTETPPRRAQEPSLNEYACDNDAIWRDLKVKGFSGAAILTTVQGVKLPTPLWRPCSDQKYCEKLELSPSQRIVTFGQDGNRIRMMVAERCGDSTSITLGEPDSPFTTALKAQGMILEAAVFGEERFLLSGFEHQSVGENQHTLSPPQYLVTGREGQLEELVAVRDESQSIPLAAANQILQVKLRDHACTKMIWNFPTGACDFRSPSSGNIALLGGNLIYIDEGAGMRWNKKSGTSKILSQLDWVFTDGVNVLWAAQDVLRVDQPRHDLLELGGKIVPGKAGPRPLAMGCGRMLSRDESAWWLRNIEKGTRWRIPDERFVAVGIGSVVMDCHSLIFQSGRRLLLKGLGEPEPVL